MLNEYTQLFAQGYKSVDEVEAEFNEAFGESFQYIDPVFFAAIEPQLSITVNVFTLQGPHVVCVSLRQTMAELMRQVEISQFSGPDLDGRRDICSSNAFASSMTLDMVRPRDT